MPIDVEIGCESRAGPIFEHIHPPLIERLGDPDVIRHEIEHLAHRVRMQFRNPRVVRFAGTDCRVEFVMIRNVVTVETFGARLKIRRCVSITHTERVQIRNNLARLRKSEPAVELQPIGASRNARMVLLCHFVRHSKRSRGISSCLHRVNQKTMRDVSTPLDMTRAYIFSGTLMPSKSRPRCKTRPLRSHSARRELRTGSSDFNTGQDS